MSNSGTVFSLAEADRANFFGLVDRRRSTECWPWKGKVIPKDRRGIFRVAGATITAPRVMLAYTRGEMPAKGLFACHSCDNPNCVNPDHLWWGTNADNLKDAGRKKRLATTKRTHCPKGHPLSGDNLAIVKGTQRRCLRCTNDYRRKRRARRVAMGLPCD